MKKALISCLTLVAAAAVAAPTAQITFSTGFAGNRFYQDAAFTVPTDAGWYVELIIQSGTDAYNPANFETYLVLVEDGIGFYNPNASFHETGKDSAGNTISAGRTAVAWQTTDTTYNGYYVTWRVYDNADKNLASSYLVVPTWKQLAIPAPAEPTSVVLLSWASTADNAYMQYELTPIPEPTTIALFGLGGLALMIRRKLRKDKDA